MILLHKADSSQLKEGDVICYLVSGKAITYRIVEITNRGGWADPLYYAGRCQQYGRPAGGNCRSDTGNLVDPYRRPGDFVMFMQSTTGMILFIICPLLLFILWDIWRRWRLDKVEAARTAELEAELAALKANKAEADADSREKE